MSEVLLQIIAALPEKGTIAVGLVIVFFWLLATDRVVTGPSHQRELAHKDEVIETQKVALGVKDSQLEDLSVVGETQVKILDSIYRLAQERGEDQ